MKITTLVKMLLQAVTPRSSCAATGVRSMRLPQRMVNRHSAFLYHSQRHYRDEQYTE